MLEVVVTILMFSVAFALTMVRRSLRNLKRKQAEQNKELETIKDNGSANIRSGT